MKSIIKIALGIVLAFLILCFLLVLIDDDKSSSSTSNIAQNVEYDDDDDLDWDLDDWDEINDLLAEMNAMIEQLDSEYGDDDSDCSGYGYSHHGGHSGHHHSSYYDDDYDDDDYYDDDDDDDYYDDDNDDDDYYQSSNNNYYDDDDDDDDNYAPQPTVSHQSQNQGSSHTSSPSSNTSASGKLIEMDLASFNKNVADLNTDNGTFIGRTPCIVMLWADWCDYCQTKLEPLLEKLAVKFKGQIKFYKLNVDENESVFKAYDLQSLPTLILGYGEDIQISTGTPNEDWMKNQIKNMLSE
ncbi:MAG: thioredoxin family protein [Bacteroidales bacterium]|nr:thioredoxin family protein [Bacteroidales bacterium]